MLNLRTAVHELDRIIAQTVAQVTMQNLIR